MILILKLLLTRKNDHENKIDKSILQQINIIFRQIKLHV